MEQARCAVLLSASTSPSPIETNLARSTRLSKQYSNYSCSHYRNHTSCKYPSNPAVVHQRPQLITKEGIRESFAQISSLWINVAQCCSANISTLLDYDVGNDLHIGCKDKSPCCTWLVLTVTIELQENIYIITKKNYVKFVNKLFFVLQFFFNFTVFSFKFNKIKLVFI